MKVKSYKKREWINMCKKIIVIYINLDILEFFLSWNYVFLKFYNIFLWKYEFFFLLNKFSWILQSLVICSIVIFSFPTSWLCKLHQKRKPKFSRTPSSFAKCCVTIRFLVEMLYNRKLEYLEEKIFIWWVKIYVRNMKR